MDDVPKTASRRTINWHNGLYLGLLVLAAAVRLMFRYLPRLRGTGIVVTARGDALVYRPSTWLSLLTVLPAAIPLVAGLILVRKGSRPRRLLGGTLLLVAVLLVVAIAPMILLPGLVLDPNGFTSTHGFWWQPVSKTVRFEDLTAIVLVSRRNGNGDIDDDLRCLKRGGGSVAMPLGDNLFAALPAIRQRARRHNVALVDLRAGAGALPARPGGATPGLSTTALAVAAALFVGFFAFFFLVMRRLPANRMGRLLQSGDAEGAIQIGESVPRERRDFSTRCNLVIAYQRAGRERDARALFSEIEAEGWTPKLGPEEQHQIILDHLRELVGLGPSPDQPAPSTTA